MTIRPDIKQHRDEPRYMRGMRLACGFTVLSWAKQLGVSERQIMRWESGAAPYSYPVQFTAESICHFIGVKLP